jgi:hypothetical protein
MTCVHVRAMAVWTARYPSLAAWRERAASEPSVPAAAILGARARGRASMLTRMISEVATSATQAAAVELAHVPLIVGSAYGEMETTSQLLTMMSEGDGTLSPARFQSSVHNAAAGLLSITTGNQGFSSCLAAGDATAAALLFEAQGWLAEHGGDVLVILAEERLPGFFAHNEAFEPAAAALLLSASAEQALATLEPSRHATDAVARTEHPELGRTPVAPLLALIDAVSDRRSEVLVPAFGSPLCVALRYKTVR